jgi:hypothetical protein
MEKTGAQIILFAFGGIFLLLGLFLSKPLIYLLQLFVSITTRKSVRISEVRAGSKVKISGSVRSIKSVIAPFSQQLVAYYSATVTRSYYAKNLGSNRKHCTSDVISEEESKEPFIITDGTGDIWIENQTVDAPVTFKQGEMNPVNGQIFKFENTLKDNDQVVLFGEVEETGGKKILKLNPKDKWQFVTYRSPSQYFVAVSGVTSFFLLIGIPFVLVGLFVISVALNS